MTPLSSPVFSRPNELHEFEYYLTKKKLILNPSFDLTPPKELPKQALKFVWYAVLLVLLTIGLQTQDKMGNARIVLQILSVLFVLVHLRNAYWAYKLKLVEDRDEARFYSDLKEDILKSDEFSDFLQLRVSRLEWYKLAEELANLDDGVEVVKEILKDIRNRD
jgi:hypothetical protein